MEFVSSYFSSIISGLGGLISPFVTLANVNLATLIVLFILLAMFLFGITFGKSRLLLWLLSLYVARILELRFSYFDFLGGYFPNLSEAWLHFGVFAVFMMLVFVLLQNSILLDRLSLANASIISVAVLSVLSLGFLATLILSYLPPTFYDFIQPKFLNYFITENAQFWWATVPILSIFFLKRRYN